MAKDTKKGVPAAFAKRLATAGKSWGAAKEKAAAAGTGFTEIEDGKYMARLVSATIVKELGPVLTALMVTGRVGSGIAAELGSMVVTEQISALRALGTDPVRKLVVPRVLAGLVMVPILTVIANGVGMVGAWIITVTQLGVSGGVFWNSVVQGLYIQDVWMGLIKPFLASAAPAYACASSAPGSTGSARRSTCRAH